MSTSPRVNPLGYQGVQSQNPPAIWFRDRDPNNTIYSDYRNYEIGDFWQNTLSKEFFILVSKPTNQGIWESFTGSSSSAILTINSFGPNGSGNFQLVAGTNITLTAGATGTLTINAFSGGGVVTSVSGTAGQIVVTPTTGNCVVSIDPTYIGQASITTLGTITTGTWHGGVIAGQYGGTGVANTGLTINLGAATSGYVLTSDAMGNGTWRPAATGVTPISAFRIALSAYRTGVSGGGVPYTIIYDTPVFDINGNVSALTTFTAPVTGIYNLTAAVTISGVGSTNTSGIFAISCSSSGNSTLVGFNPFALNPSSDFETITTTGVAYLTAGDTVTTIVTVYGSSINVGGAGSNNYFCGTLISPNSGIIQTTGTWTPTIIGNSSAGTTTYVEQLGNWIRTGNEVHVEGYMTITGATGTGEAIFSLPFTSAGDLAVGTLSVIGSGGGSWTWGTGNTYTALSVNMGTKTAVALCTGSGTTSTYLQMQNTASYFDFTIDYLTTDPP